MASGTVTEAVQSGRNIRVTVAVDEGPVGLVPYTVEVPIADLKALGSQPARRKALLDAVKAERDKRLQDETVIEAFLAQLHGATVEV